MIYRSMLVAAALQLFGGSADFCLAETNLPAWVLSVNGKETNYIAQVLGSITNATERAFLQAVILDDKNGQLAKSLGYIGTVHYIEFGTYPGQNRESDYADMGFAEVYNFQRMCLVFDSDDPDRQRRILVFAQFHGIPGMNNHGVAIVDNQFNILDWRLSETSDRFESASLDKAKQRLVVTCKRQTGRKVDYLYDLLDNKVTVRIPDPIDRLVTDLFLQ